MSLIRECDRCKHRTPVESLNGRDFRGVSIERGATASSSGGGCPIIQRYDLCRNCLVALDEWVKMPDVAKVSS
jgi:hypothetical protein